MSLKSKLEAVIYAAEEPVTLTQLAALFAAEAFEWKAEQEAAAAAAKAAVEGTEPSTAPLPMLDESLEYLGLEQTPDFYASSEAQAASAEAAPEPSSDPTSEDAPQDTSADSAPASAEAAPGDPVDAESEAKRFARQRDREIKAILRQILNELIADYANDVRGIEIREIAGGYRMATKPECHDAVRLFIKSLKPPMKLSLPALETLAVIAYKQPVTAPEVNEIRGVDSGGVFGSLLSRKLITTAGRKQVIGRPILYKTTKEFLLRFGLKDISELPSMEEFEKIAAVELSETEPGEVEPVPGEGVTEENVPEGTQELDEDASEEDSESTDPATVAQADGVTTEPEPAPPAEPEASNQQAHSENSPHD